EVERQARARLAELPPRTAWEECGLGRRLLAEGDLERAAGHLERAVALEPGGFWPNFSQGVCAFRRERYREAVSAFRAAVALAPRSAPAYYNRGLAHDRLGEDESALRDYARAL